MSRWWMRVKETGEPFIITSRTGHSVHHGTYGLGYRDEGRIITALKASGELVRRGMSFKELEIVNQNGVTLEAMKKWPIEVGFALRHMTEKWYWSRPNTGRIWYKRASDIETAWIKNEWAISLEEKRKPRRSPRVAKLVLVKCVDGDAVQELPNWFC